MTKQKEEQDHHRLENQLEAYTGPSSLSGRPLREWGPYAAAASAAVGMAVSADADIVYSGITNLTVSASAPLPGTGSFESTFMSNSLQLNVDGSFGADLTLNAVVTNRYINFGGIIRTRIATAAVSGNVMTSGGFLAQNLLSGANIGATETFSTSGLNRGVNFNSTFGATSSNSSGNWTNSVSALAGFSFQRGTNTHYGWVRLHVSVNHSPIPNSSITAVDFAWEDTPNQAIEAGSMMTIPEPSSLGLLALGAAGVAATRRRRKKADA